MSAITIIRKGGDLKFVFDREGEDISNFICTIEVKQFPDDSPLIGPRVIPPVGNEWPGILTSTDTDLLSVGLFWLIAKLTNSITDEERQIPERFQVTKPWF